MYLLFTRPNYLSLAILTLPLNISTSDGLISNPIHHAHSRLLPSLSFLLLSFSHKSPWIPISTHSTLPTFPYSRLLCTVCCFGLSQAFKRIQIIHYLCSLLVHLSPSHVFCLASMDLRFCFPISSCSTTVPPSVRFQLVLFTQTQGEGVSVVSCEQRESVVRDDAGGARLER